MELSYYIIYTHNAIDMIFESNVVILYVGFIQVKIIMYNAFQLNSGLEIQTYNLFANITSNLCIIPMRMSILE